MSAVEHITVAACRFEEGKVVLSVASPWVRQDSASNKTNDPQLSSSSSSAAATPALFSVGSIRIAPMSRRRRTNAPALWDADLHFHKQLQLPVLHHKAPCVCLWQAKARECVSLALSPRPGFVRGRTYEVTFGAAGNTHTVLKYQTTEVSALAHVCHEQTWVSYWVCLVEATGKLYAGVGPIPGKQCVAILDARQCQQKGRAEEEREAHVEDETPPEEEREEGESSSPTQRQLVPDPSKSQDETKGPPPETCYVGFGNSAVFDRQAPAFLHVRNICLTTATAELLSTLEQLSHDNLDTVVIGTDDDGNEMMGGADSTMAIFREYQAECRKNRLRAAKFGVPYQEPPPDAFLPWSQARRLRANPKTGFATGLDLQDPNEKAKQEARRQRFGLPEASAQETAAGENDVAGLHTITAVACSIPIVQAWDNEDFVKSQRIDPPVSLWKCPPSDAETSEPEVSEFGVAEQPTLVPEKIHIFSIDWAAFKQIRTKDIMAHFSIYGPSYVEWLGDLSCNVLFADRFSVARALENLSQEIMTPVPDDVTASRQESAEPPTDLGRQGWRLGKTMLRKVSNDRYGRRGTTARLLMRVATSLDVLHQRPSSWPKPPPGFSTKLILGPGSDFKQGRRASRKGKRGRGDASNSEAAISLDYSAAGDEPPSLGGALAAGRAGFSVEEMEAERATKKAKTT